MTVPQARRGDLLDPACPTRQLLDRVGSKWVSMLFRALGDPDEPEVRFAELRRRAPGISSKVLAQTLRALERDGLVHRRVEPTVPPRVHYSLTGLGTSLQQPLAVMRDWAERHMATVDQSRAEYDATAD